MHPTLGILRKSQAVFYASVFFQSDAVPPPAPARVTQSVRTKIREVLSPSASAHLVESVQVIYLGFSFGYQHAYHFWVSTYDPFLFLSSYCLKVPTNSLGDFAKTAHQSRRAHPACREPRASCFGVAQRQSSCKDGVIFPRREFYAYLPHPLGFAFAHAIVRYLDFFIFSLW